MHKKAIILANGQFPQNEIPLNELRISKYIICCDGAINKLEAAKLKSYAIVGDLDSLKPHLKKKYSEILYHFPDQDSNDLTKAVNWCVKNEFKEIVIVGATGHRDDHMIGNVFLLPLYAKKIKVKMLTDYGTFTPILQSTDFESYAGQQVSLFSLNPTTLVTTVRLKYPLTRQKLPMLWQGTLNESQGNSFRIEFEGGPLIVFQKY